MPVVLARPCGPAEEDIAGRLHRALAGHDALARVAKGTGAAVGLQYRPARFLELQEKRIAVAGHQQQDAAERAHAAHAHHLDGVVYDLEAVQQQSPCGDQRCFVRLQRFRGILAHGCVTPVAVVEDQRRLVDNARHIAG